MYFNSLGWEREIEPISVIYFVHRFPMGAQLNIQTQKQVHENCKHELTKKCNQQAQQVQ